MANRNNRESETREMSQTKYNIKDFSDEVLPNPSPDDDNEYLYVRTSVMGVDDARNVMKKRSQGYIPCKKEDHPEIPSWGNTGNEVEIGGLMLHKAPKGLLKAKKEFVAKKTSDQQAAVDANLYRQNDPRMPMFSEKKSTTTKGSRG